MSTSTIAAQVTEFNAGFAAQIGQRLAEVFDREQLQLDAAGVPTTAVSIGDSVPNADLIGADGVPARLFDELGSGRSVIVFYRGAWCPYCNIVLRHYQAELLPALQERGVSLVAISPQTPEGSTAASTSASLDFATLSDPSNQLVRHLGIVTEPTADARAAHTELGFDVADSNADATGDIPFPTVLILDSDRIVTFADVHVNYTTRTEVRDILAALDQA